MTSSAGSPVASSARRTSRTSGTGSSPRTSREQRRVDLVRGRAAVARAGVDAYDGALPRDLGQERLAGPAAPGMGLSEAGIHAAMRATGGTT